MARLFQASLQVFGFALVLLCSSVQADQLDELIGQYKRYGLPLPTADAELVVIKHRGGTFNGVQQYSKTLSFIESSAGKDQYWYGCRTYPLDETAEVLRVNLTPDLVSQTDPDELRFVYTPGMPTFADLALAMHCKLRGHSEIASALLDQNRVALLQDPFNLHAIRPSGNEQAIALLAWNYWCNEFAISRADRTSIIQRLTELLDSKQGLDNERNRNILSDMRMTLDKRHSKPDSLHEAIDSLVDLGIERGYRGIGFAHADIDANHKGIRKLREAGLDAVPVLIEHINDFRLTRCMDKSSRGAWHVRISDVVKLLLDGLSNQEFSYDFLIDEGRGVAADRQHVLYWWASTKGSKAVDYLLQNAFVRSDDDKVLPNTSILHALGTQFPKRFEASVRKHIPIVDQPRGLFDAVSKSELNQEVKTELYLAGAVAKNIYIRRDAIAMLLQEKHPRAVSLATLELERLPKTPQEDYWLSSAQMIAQMASQTDDQRVWCSLLTNARRVDLGQRLQMLQGVSDCSGKHNEQAITFMREFLNDKEVRVLPSVQELANQMENNDSSTSKSREPNFSGPCAGFMFNKLTVRNYAALRLADFLEIKSHPESGWKQEDWDRLHSQVREKLNDPAASSK